MQIRDAARRVLGSEYFDALRSPPDPAPRLELQVPPPPPRPARRCLWSSESRARGGSFAAGASSELLCNTSQSVSSFEVQHDLSDPKDEDFVNKTYYVGVDVPVGVAAGGAERLGMCKKNDGMRWFCKRTASEPNSLCSYHSDNKRVAAPLAPPSVSKPSTSSKPTRRRKAVDTYEPYLYYDGFGPSRSKRYFKGGSISSILLEIPHVVEQQESPPAEL